MLITVHFALGSGGPIASVFYGMSIGLVQDSLSHQPIGMYRNRQNPGGILRCLCQSAIRCPEPDGYFYPRVLLLLFSSVLLLGSVARAAGRSNELRPAANCNFWAVKCRRGPAVVPLLDKLKVAAKADIVKLHVAPRRRTKLRQYASARRSEVRRPEDRLFSVLYIVVISCSWSPDSGTCRSAIRRFIRSARSKTASSPFRCSRRAARFWIATGE